MNIKQAIIAILTKKGIPAALSESGDVFIHNGLVYILEIEDGFEVGTWADGYGPKPKVHKNDPNIVEKLVELAQEFGPDLSVEISE